MHIGVVGGAEQLHQAKPEHRADGIFGHAHDVIRIREIRPIPGLYNAPHTAKYHVRAGHGGGRAKKADRHQATALAAYLARYFAARSRISPSSLNRPMATLQE